MRDPYDVLGVSNQASFEEVKAAYRRACKTKHPDMGGSPEAFIELQNAYETILDNLKRSYARQRQEAPAGQTQRENTEQRWERAYRDIDDELEELRRSARAREDALRAMRTQAWQDGNKVAWAKLTWKDLTGFLAGLLRGGVKGLAVLLAALIGLGSVLVEANAVSALIMFGAGIGFVFSHALKSDKGGMLSAALLLFGIMTIWLPPVRQALIHYPLATVSLLLCLALIFKFGQQGGMVGLMTGGVLTLYVAGAIITQAEMRQVQQPVPPSSEPVTPGRPSVATTPPSSSAPREPPTSVPSTPEVRTLIASKGAVLKMVAGVAYNLQVRGGLATSIRALRGSAAPYHGNEQVGVCSDKLDLFAPSSKPPYVRVESTFRACGSDALLRVIDIH